MHKTIIGIIIFILFFGVFSFAQLNLKFETPITVSPASLTVGDNAVFTVTFKAQNGSATNCQVIGGIDGTTIYNNTFASIAAGATKTISFTWSAASGAHTAWFELDPNNTTGDKYPENNKIQLQINVQGGSSLSWDASTFSMTPANPNTGDQVNFLLKFKVELGPADNVKVIAGMDGTTRATHTFPHVDQGQSIEMGFTSIVNEGTHEVFFELDPDKTSSDLNFNDNKYIKSITANSLGTDLAWVANSFYIEPAPPVYGDKVFLRAKYFINYEGVNNLKVIAKINGVVVNTENFTHLDIGQKYFNFYWWAWTTGNQQVSFVLDPQNTTGDRDASNNTLQYNFAIPTLPPGGKPNLKMIKIEFLPERSTSVNLKLPSAQLKEGDQARLHFVFENDGAVAAKGCCNEIIH